MSIKLFCNWFVQFTILWFYSSLKQAVNRNWVHFVFFRSMQSSQLSFWFSTGTGSKLWPIKIRAFISVFFWMNDDLYYYWIHYRLFCTYSNSVSGFWINNSVRDKKIQVWRYSLFGRLIFVHRYHYKFVGIDGELESIRRQFKNF